MCSFMVCPSPYEVRFDLELPCSLGIHCGEKLTTNIMGTPRAYFSHMDQSTSSAGLAADLDPRIAGRVVFGGALAVSLSISIASWALGETMRVSYALVVALAALVSLALNARGRTRPAVVLLLLVMTICGLTACFLFKGVEDVAASLFPVIIVLAGITLDRRLLVFFAVSISVGVVGISLARWSTHHPSRFTFSQALDVVMVVLIYCLAALITGRLAAYARGSLQMARESEERFRSLFENATLGIYRTTPNGQINAANPTLIEMLGFDSFTALAGCNLEEAGFEPAYSRHAFRQILDREGVIRGLETKWTRRDGAALFVRESARAIKDENGAVRFYEGIVEDITERMRAEEAVRESEFKYRALVETTDTGYLIVDAQGRVTDANQQYVKLTGHEQLAEILGRNVTEWTAPHDLERNADEIMKCVERGFVRNLEIDYVDRQGMITPIEINATIIRSGDATQILSLCQDITGRKAVEKELLRQSEFIQATLDNISDGVVACDGAGNLALFNRTAREWHGIDALKLPPEQWASHYDLFDSDGTTALRTELIPLKRAYSGEHLHDVEMTIAAKGQPLRHLLASGRPFFDNKGLKLGAVVGMHDITERKQAEQSLRESEERFRATYEQAAVGIAHLAADGRFRRINQRFCQIVGYSQEEMLERTYQEITHPADLDTDLELAGRLLSGEIKTYTREKRYIHKDGSQIWVNLTISLVRNKAGDPDWRVCVVQDITDSKHAQEKAFERQRLESVGTLASGIAHDFNNLLGGVLAQAELAMAEISAGSFPVEQLKEIQSGALRGSEIVRELMIYAGKESAVVGPVDVSQVVKEMLGLLNVSVSKHAKLEVDLGQDLPAVRTNAAQIGRIVMNLVTNASEALGDQDGVIRVTTNQLTGDRDSSGATLEAPGECDYVQLKVSDTGSGMSQETQAKVFDPFFTTKSGGRGLGLAVVHGIVNSLGGSIHLTSEHGEGTTFQVLLPCAAAPTLAPPRRTSPRQEPAHPSREARVLIVEDENSLLQPVSKLLRNTGFYVIEASDGSAALEAIREHEGPIDVLLLDITLPGASSRDVFAEAKRLRPEMKVIVTSAYNEDTAAASLEARVENFIRKPYRINDLLAFVDRILP